MRRASPAVLALLVVALLAGCGGSGDRSASIGATVTIPAGVHGAREEVVAVLDQFPYQRWYTSCVERHVGDSPATDAEDPAETSDSEREAKLSRIIARVGPICQASSKRPLIDPNATSEELDLLRAELVPRVDRLATTQGLDPDQAACVTNAFEKLPDRYIVQFGDGDEKSRGAILLTVFETCAAAG